MKTRKKKFNKYKKTKHKEKIFKSKNIRKSIKKKKKYKNFKLGDNYNNRYQHWENEFLEWNLNKNRESSSGPGSTINNTKNTLKTLNYIINNFNIKTLLDVPCGDILKLKLHRVKPRVVMYAVRV